MKKLQLTYLLLKAWTLPPKVRNKTRISALTTSGDSSEVNKKEEISSIQIGKGVKLFADDMTSYVENPKGIH